MNYYHWLGRDGHPRRPADIDGKGFGIKGFTAVYQLLAKHL